ncbi:MAG: hypothetical protein ACE5LH_01265 [Fidelibacterota bacterium]
MFALFMIVLTFFLVGTFVIQPLLQKPMSGPAPDDASTHALLLRKQVVYRQIKEAEMEFEIGNLSREDFETTRDQLKQEAAQILAQLRKKG